MWREAACRAALGTTERQLGDLRVQVEAIACKASGLPLCNSGQGSPACMAATQRELLRHLVTLHELHTQLEEAIAQLEACPECDAPCYPASGEARPAWPPDDGRTALLEECAALRQQFGQLQVRRTTFEENTLR